MSLLDDSTIAELRGIEVSAMPETVTIKRPTTTHGAGGSRTTFADVATVAGSYWTPLQPQEQAIAGRYGVTTATMVALPYGTDVRASDRLIITSGPTLDVVGVLTGGAWETSRRCVCKEVG